MSSIVNEYGHRASSARSAAGANMLADSTAGFRLHNGTTYGPTVTEWGTLASTRLTQGVVTVDFAVNPRLHEVRAETSETRAEHERIGALKNADDLRIEEHDLVWGMRSRATGRGGSAFCFAAFNGLNVAAYHHQDDFEDSLVCYGRAKIPYIFGSPEQGNHGISVQVRGGYSIANIGKHDLFVGDSVRVRAPPIDKRERARNREEFHKPQGYNPRKEVGSIEPATYAQIHRMPQRAFAQYMTVARDTGDEAVRTRHANPRVQTRHASRLVRFAITCFRAAGLAKLWAGLAVLAEKNAITINAAVVTSNALSAADYSTTLRLLNEPLEPATTIAPAAAGQLVTLAYAFDLVDAAPRDAHIKPAGQLIHDVLETQFRGLAPPTSQAFARLPFSRFVKPASGANGLTPKLAEALDRMQVNAALRQFAAFSETKRREDEKVIGQCIRNAVPGGVIDVVS